jgi:DNA repair protein SbcD/Mre11
MRILLTSDLHLGMKFAGYPDAQAVLTEARFTCLERVVAAANDARADLLVVAGDLFERVNVPRRDVQRAAEALRGFSGRLAAVMPGNHDYIAPRDELWPRFRDSCGDAVLVMDEARPYPLAHYDLDACLYPGPCTAGHSAANAIGWVKEARKDHGVRHHIGVAHGSLEGFSPDMDERYYPMRRQELLEAGVRPWLLGHTHVRYPAAPGPGERIFNAGTPEPDGLDCTHEGYAWLLDLDDADAVSARALRTGSLRFAERTVRVRDAAGLERAFDVAGLARDLGGAEAGRTVLRLRLEGRVPAEVRASLGALQARMKETLLSLDLRAEELREEITVELIDREYPAGSFPHALLRRLSEAGDQDALEAAREILQEVRP